MRSLKSVAPRRGAAVLFVPTFALGIVLGVCGIATADNINVPADFPTIQEAIDVAMNGDEICVAPGTYNETIDFLGKAITVYSSDGPEVTTIDATGLNDSVVKCTSGEGPGTVLRGFTITGGVGTVGGSLNGIEAFLELLVGPSFGPLSVGGGMYNDDSSPTVTDCIFADNTAGAGAGIMNIGGSPSVTNCAFIQNVAIAGGGMANDTANPSVTNCSFSENISDFRFFTFGGGMANFSSNATVDNCILWGDLPVEITNFAGGTTTVRFSDVQGGWSGAGTNNINANPLFVDAPNGDLRLAADSPCIDAADNTAVPAGITTDLDGNPRFVDDPDTPDCQQAPGECGDPPVVDMGAYELQGAALLIGLDIKPGSCPNSYNRNSHGVLPVALVGTDTFDVAQVDISSIQLSRADGVGGSVTPHEGPPGPHSVFEDVATPFDGQPCDCHELESDGLTDLSMKFKTDDVVADLQLNDLPAGDLVELVVSGTLLDGTPFSASDCIRLVPPGTPGGLLAVGSNLPGAWLDVSPLDLQLDGGGFANFERTYPLTMVVTLTAPQMHDGWRFVGWWTHRGLYPGQSINITIGGEQQRANALYAPAGPTAARIVP